MDIAEQELAEAGLSTRAVNLLLSAGMRLCDVRGLSEPQLIEAVNGRLHERCGRVNGIGEKTARHIVARVNGVPRDISPMLMAVADYFAEHGDQESQRRLMLMAMEGPRERDVSQATAIADHMQRHQPRDGAEFVAWAIDNGGQVRMVNISNELIGDSGDILFQRFVDIRVAMPPVPSRGVPFTLTNVGPTEIQQGATLHFVVPTGGLIAEPADDEQPTT